MSHGPILLAWRRAHPTAAPSIFTKTVNHATFTASVNQSSWGNVELTFAKRKLEASMASHEARVRAFGAERAGKLNTRLTQLHDAERLEERGQYRVQPKAFLADAMNCTAIAKDSWQST